MKNFKTLVWAQIFIIYTRYIIGGAFVFASLIKIKGNRFTTESGALYPIDNPWHFFETMYQSGLYWKFIGAGQLIAGFLLMTQKYAKLGAIINFPIILNIFVITISYYFALTPVITGMVLLANILLFAWDWNEFKVLFNLTPIINSDARLEKDRVWQITGLTMFLFTFIYRVLVDKYNVFFWGVIFTIIGFIGLLVGLSRHRKIKNSS
ncbi:hypothetical protein [uncultured Polaribacter sp.]|uniref:hypothetical protein n=1 Tax=uncultured Polaribacter sp. TaxID=174711 RepID=UPI00262C5246|nr:hypothetical protein [uncultured Polaribacter sp.]